MWQSYAQLIKEPTCSSNFLICIPESIIYILLRWYIHVQYYYWLVLCFGMHKGMDWVYRIGNKGRGLKKGNTMVFDVWKMVYNTFYTLTLGWRVVSIALTPYVFLIIHNIREYNSDSSHTIHHVCINKLNWLSFIISKFN